MTTTTFGPQTKPYHVQIQDRQGYKLWHLVLAVDAWRAAIKVKDLDNEVCKVLAVRVASLHNPAH